MPPETPINEIAQRLHDEVRSKEVIQGQTYESTMTWADMSEELKTKSSTENRRDVLTATKEHLTALTRELETKKATMLSLDELTDQVEEVERDVEATKRTIDQKLNETPAAAPAAAPANGPVPSAQLIELASDFIPQDQLDRQGGPRAFFAKIGGKAINGLVGIIRFFKSSGSFFFGMLGLNRGADAAQRQENERMLNGLLDAADRLTGEPEVKAANYRGIIERALDGINVVPGRGDQAAVALIERTAFPPLSQVPSLPAEHPARIEYERLQAQAQVQKDTALAALPAVTDANRVQVEAQRRTIETQYATAISNGMNAAKGPIVEAYINQTLIPLYMSRVGLDLPPADPRRPNITVTVGVTRAQITLAGVAAVLEPTPRYVRPSVVPVPPAADRPSFFSFGRRQPSGPQPQPRPNPTPRP